MNFVQRCVCSRSNHDHKEDTESRPGDIWYPLLATLRMDITESFDYYWMPRYHCANGEHSPHTSNTGQLWCTPLSMHALRRIHRSIWPDSFLWGAAANIRSGIDTKLALANHIWNSDKLINLYLNECAEKQADIEHHVQCVTDKVQCGVIKAQADDAFATEIRDHLRIEGNGPCHKIDPANNWRQLDVEVGVGDYHTNK